MLQKNNTKGTSSTNSTSKKTNNTASSKKEEPKTKLDFNISKPDSRDLSLFSSRENFADKTNWAKSTKPLIIMALITNSINII
jgi:hypothetical protein